MSALWRPYSIPGQGPSLLHLVSGQGSYVRDAKGRNYLNATSGLWNVSLGLGNQQIIERMHTQARTMAYAPLFDFAHSPAELVAEKLVELSDGRMHHVYLSTTGSSAVEVALRVARLHHAVRKRPNKVQILSFDNSYHGCSWMNLCASGIVKSDLVRYGEHPAPDFTHLPSPKNEGESLDALQRCLAKDAERIACLIMEPVSGTGGIIVPSQEYCTAVSDVCRAYDVLLIADEVATGGGRCGTMFASSQLQLRPDIIALSKGLNSGYFPLGATLFADHVADPIRSAGAVIQYGSTQDGNPIGCVATLSTITQVAEQGLCERALELGRRIRAGLSDLVGGSAVREVRGLGLMLGIELAHSCLDGQLFNEDESLQVRQRCQDEGLLVYHFESGLSLFPPLTMSDEEADDMIEILHDVLKAG